MREVKSTLKTLGATVIYADGPYGKIPHADLVITIGGDGTLLAASHQIGAGIPLLGVNSAPESSVGFFSAAKGGQIGRVLRAALAGKLQATALTRMQVDLNGKTVHARVLNEALVCHTSPAATSRYILSITKKKKTASEDQRSSGIWIGPAAGSTAAQRSAGGKVLPLLSSKLQYVVREPYTPIGKRLKLRVGLVDPDGYLELRSKMREAKMFLDGQQRRARRHARRHHRDAQERRDPQSPRVSRRSDSS